MLLKALRLYWQVSPRPVTAVTIPSFKMFFMDVLLLTLVTAKHRPGECARVAISFKIIFRQGMLQFQPPLTSIYCHRIYSIQKHTYP